MPRGIYDRKKKKKRAGRAKGVAQKSKTNGYVLRETRCSGCDNTVTDMDWKFCPWCGGQFRP